MGNTLVNIRATGYSQEHLMGDDGKPTTEEVHVNPHHIQLVRSANKSEAFLGLTMIVMSDDRIVWTNDGVNGILGQIDRAIRFWNMRPQGYNGVSLE